MLRAASVVALLLPIPILSLTGQGGAVASKSTPARRWAVSISIGWSWGNSHSALERSLTAGGFNDPFPCLIFCGSVAEPEPSSTGGLVTSTLALSYAVRPSLDVRLQEMSADLGETSGYNAASASARFLSLHQAVRSIAAFPVVNLGGILRIGVGPALHFVNVSRTDSPGGPPFKATRFGAVVYGGLTTRRRVFLEVSAQYIYVPSVDVGPIATMPLTHVVFTHPTLSASLGVRF